MSAHAAPQVRAVDDREHPERGARAGDQARVEAQGPLDEPHREARQHDRQDQHDRIGAQGLVGLEGERDDHHERPVPQVDRVRPVADDLHGTPLPRAADVDRRQQHERGPHGGQQRRRAGERRVAVEAEHGHQHHHQADERDETASTREDEAAMDGQGHQRAQQQLPDAGGRDEVGGAGVHVGEADAPRQRGGEHRERHGRQPRAAHGQDGRDEDRPEQVELLLDAQRPVVLHGVGAFSAAR